MQSRVKLDLSPHHLHIRRTRGYQYPRINTGRNHHSVPHKLLERGEVELIPFNTTVWKQLVGHFGKSTTGCVESEHIFWLQGFL